MSRAERRRERATALDHSHHPVHVDIDRLALYGIAPAAAARLAVALEAEFSALALQPAIGFSPAEIARLPSARISAGPTPEQTARAAAGAIWSGIAGIGPGVGQGKR